ncbi:MAG TPA: hypothetical protein VGS19_01010 [Streptosporangiaceae bacterium]|nr:hypothetical protein [Streptosporangiaceae bacterium]
MHTGTTRPAHKRLWGSRRRRLWSGATAIAATAALGAAAAGLTGVGSPSSAAVHAKIVHGAQPAGAVSPHPAAGTPELPISTTAATDEIKQIVQCGTTMYAVGQFTQVISNGTTLTRDNLFSFSATAPYTLTSLAPSVNGAVNSIALTSNCAHAFIGGSFTKVDGATADNIAYIRTSDGSLVARWGRDANNQVQTLALTNSGHLLVGGQFTSINGSNNAYFTSLNPATGADDGFLRLNISGHYHWCSSTGQCNVIFPTQVANQQLSHSGTLDLAEGVFTSVGGQTRGQIFMINLATSPATVTPWTSPEFDGSQSTPNTNAPIPFECYGTESYYLRDAAWSPDDSTIYTAETGYHPWNLPTGTYPRSGLCDASAAWPATQGVVNHTWVNYTGCDSLFSVAADSAAVYVAGHPRWSENGGGCNAPGPGAVADAGMQGLDPATGNVLENADGSPVYTMSRANAGDMLITSAGLWIGSTNRYGTSWCNGDPNHTALCFLPYSS